MGHATKISASRQVRIPKAMEKLRLAPGDYLEFAVENGRLVATAKTLVDKEQAWYWTPRVQKALRESEADLKAGRVHRFRNVRDARRHFGLDD